VTVATFTHGLGTEAAGQFAATIAWGDGTTSAGTVTKSGATYSISGSHTYADEGVFHVSVAVVDDAANATISATATMLEELLPGGVRGTANQRFVSEVYRDLLDRGVDPGGLGFWSGKVDGGLDHRLFASDFMTNGPEYATSIIQQAYQTYLHRAADSGGLNYFLGVLADGGTYEQVVASLASSQEYFDHRGGGTNSGFLAAVYQDVLHRAIDPAGQAQFSQELTHGVSRGQVLDEILSSDEYRRDVVQTLFAQLLDRPAEAASQQYFLNQLQHGATDQDIIAQIIASDEFFNKTSA
ncbi:MAG TPA: DUF4214 domain-containing protein, partial [Pirellulales bacterium]|nr:DUF4214 domain-containing protein [Pirellulales bacterium]